MPSERSYVTPRIVIISSISSMSMTVEDDFADINIELSMTEMGINILQLALEAYEMFDELEEHMKS